MTVGNRKSFVQAIAELANTDPERVAIYDEEKEITIGELELSSNRMARTFQAHDVSFDDIVTMVMPNSIELMISILACWKLGALPNPVAASMPRAELEKLTASGNPALIMTDDAVGLEYACLPTKFETDPSTSAEPLPKLDKVGSERALASGGSTGTPKLIIPSNKAELISGSVLSLFRAKNATLVPGPICHATPFTAAWQGVLNGSTVVLTKKFDAERFLSLVERHQVDRLTLVPTMMLRIWNLPEKVRLSYDVSSLEMVISGGAPLPAWLMRAWIDWLGADVMYEAYGPSERIGGTLISGQEWLEHPGSVGRALSYCTVKILDDAGAQCPPGQMGEVYFMPTAGAGSTYTYRGATSQRNNEGWESVGDMGYLDEDGYLYLGDRRADMIIINGRNIYPAEIEGAIERYSSVRSCAVIGLPDGESDQIIHAIVDSESASLDDDTLKAHLKELISSYKIPRSFEYVNSPLRNDAGKVRRSALRVERLNQRRL